MSKNIDNKRKDDEFIEKKIMKKMKNRKKADVDVPSGTKSIFLIEDYIIWVYLEYKYSCDLMIRALHPIIQSSLDNRKTPTKCKCCRLLNKTKLVFEHWTTFLPTIPYLSLFTLFKNFQIVYMKMFAATNGRMVKMGFFNAFKECLFSPTLQHVEMLYKFFECNETVKIDIQIRIKLSQTN